nr:hypothetical protein [Chloroflexia bacterium]
MSSLSYRKRPVSRGPLASRALNPVAAMRSFLMLLWIEIKRSQGFWLLPLLVGLGIFAAFYRDQDGVVLWQDLNFSTLRSYAVIAPLTAAFAAWLADRDRRRRMRDLAHSLSIAPLRRDLLTLGIASLWGMIGYAIVAVWFAWKGVSEATWGGPDLGLILAGALAIVFFAGIGGLVGSLVPSKFSPILALGVTFLLTMMFSYSSEHPLKLLMPWGLTTASGSDIYYDLLYVRESLVWLAGLLAAVIAITALARKRGAVAWTGLAASVLLAGIGAVPLIRQDSAPSGANVRIAAFDWSCAAESGIEVCLHPAYEAKLDDVSD